MPARRRTHPVFARVYTRLSPTLERQGGVDRRCALLAGLAGCVIEVGAGNGLNFAHYPPEVTAVLAVEPEAYLREAARRAALSAAVPIEVVDGVAEHLPAGDGAFDAAVVSLVLCSVADPRASLSELRRVLRPGGRLHFYEHVRATTPGLRRAQRLVDATFWPLLFGGCHTGRDTAAEIVAAGFRLERLERFRFPEGGLPVPSSPHILGVATRTLAD